MTSKIQTKNIINQKDDSSEKKKAVYSIRITEKQKELIRNNKNIKDDLDKYVIAYLTSFF